MPATIASTRFRPSFIPAQYHFRHVFANGILSVKASCFSCHAVVFLLQLPPICLQPPISPACVVLSLCQRTIANIKGITKNGLRQSCRPDPLLICGTFLVGFALRGQAQAPNSGVPDRAYQLASERIEVSKLDWIMLTARVRLLENILPMRVNVPPPQWVCPMTAMKSG